MCASKSSKASIKSRAASRVSKASRTSTKKDPTAQDDIYDKWRPPPGIKYQLSQTNVDFNAVVPRLNLKYTTVEYEPGQDLTVKDSLVRYARPRGRGPIFKFEEEIWAERARLYNERMMKLVLARVKKSKKCELLALKAMHDTLMYQIGPPWFHEMSHLQMESADSLKAAMAKDTRFKTIINTQETLCRLGLVLWPNHTKIEYALKKYNECPIEFLLTLFKLNRPKDPEKQNEYSLNDRILLSAVVHLSIREIFRELHLRIPSPPNKKDPPKPCRLKSRRRKKKIKFPKWTKGMSPYLKEQICVEQKRRHGLYKNRHKEYASLPYFDYVDDMYSVKLVDDTESVVRRKKTKSIKSNKWTWPPKIPVRYIESKMQKKTIYELKKPSSYVTICKPVLKKDEEEEDEEDEGEIVIDTNIDLDNICTCGPKKFDASSSFNLKIKVTTSDEEIFLTQKLCPYKNSDNIGDLNFVDQKKITKSIPDDKIGGRPIKRIDYTCECCICGKSVNIDPNNEADIKKSLKNEFTEGLETIPEYGEDGEMEGEDFPEPEIKVCPCRTPSTSSEDSDDTYALCTCHSSSDSCTCCICEQMDKDFLLHIKHFNDAYGTNHTPCTCNCKCKKKKPKSLCEGPQPVKYCFCTKLKEEEMEEEIEEEEREVMIEEPKDKNAKEIKKERKDSKAGKVRISSNVPSGDGSSDKTSMQEETCKCVDLYAKYVDAHSSCLSLFTHYQQKIKEDIEEYMRDLNTNRCTCGDSIISEKEGEYDMEEEEKLIKDIHDIVCNCCKDDPYAGCTCDEFAGCGCRRGSSTSSSSSSSESTDSSSEPCMCSCTCGPCECSKFVEKVKMNIDIKSKSTIGGKSTGNLQHTSLTSARRERSKSAVESTEGEQEEDDPRIYHLDEFPTNRNEQMDLLRKVLDDLASEGYPMALLPEVHRLPHFQVWLDKRSGKYVSMEDRGTLMAISKLWWTHIEVCARKVPLPHEGMTRDEKKDLTWGRVKAHQRLVLQLRTEYLRRVKQANIDQAQEYFPSMFHYKLPNKTFRNVYFAYFPADENHCHAFRPWKTFEMKNMKTRKPCC